MKQSNMKVNQMHKVKQYSGSSSESLKLLRRVLMDDTAYFRSVDQYNLTTVCQLGRYDIIGRLPCGMGKTEAVLISALNMKKKFSPNGGRIIVIAVLLLVILIPDYIKRMSQAGLSCEQWGIHTTLANAPDVLIIQLEDLNNPKLWQFLNTISKDEIPNYCVIDEFDAFLESQSYRNSGQIIYMKTMVKNFICLSATATQGDIQAISTILELQEPFILYGDSQNPNLKITLKSIGDFEPQEDLSMPKEKISMLLPTLSEIIQNIVHGNTGKALKMIIYPFFKADNPIIQNYLEEQFPEITLITFKTEFSQQEKMECIEKFKKSGNILLATEAAATGCNPGVVDYVVVMGGFRSIHLANQMAGRIGRTKNSQGKGEFIVITSPMWRYMVEANLKKHWSGTEKEKEKLEQVKLFLEGGNCLRQCLGIIDWGVPPQCQLFSGIEKCNVCEVPKVIQISMGKEKIGHGNDQPVGPEEIEIENKNGLKKPTIPSPVWKKKNSLHSSQQWNSGTSYLTERSDGGNSQHPLNHENEFFNDVDNEYSNMDWEAIDEIEQKNAKEKEQRIAASTLIRGKYMRIYIFGFMIMKHNDANSKLIFQPLLQSLEPFSPEKNNILNMV